MRQISEQSVRTGGEMPCVDGWNRGREMLAGGRGEEEKAVSSLWTIGFEEA